MPNLKLRQRKKNTVRYSVAKGLGFSPNGCALCWPLDHTGALVSNHSCVMTSRVVKAWPNGMFETENSLYVPDTVMPSTTH